MALVTWAIFILILGGVLAWGYRHRPGMAGLFGAGTCLAAGIIGLYGAGQCLLLRQYETRAALWNVPLGSFTVGLDSLTALFLLPVFLVGSLAAWSALRRLPGDYAANRPHEHWLFFNCTLGAAALALVARNAVLFLFAWETMTVASFLLIENEQRERGTRGGGWVYLTAGHIGGACLFAMFALLGAGSGGSLDFSVLKAAGGTVTAVFLLACAGFGGKIGLAPFHAWYSESYPQSPAHVGAVLSGVVGNLGVYGLLRVLFLTGGEFRAPAWWGYLLLLMGLTSGVIGAARALASKDLSRLLAWSSVENYGLMAAGIGLGLLGAASNNGIVSYLGFAAAIFHMLNHSVSKALLFLAAGSVYIRTGSRNLDTMGGLLKRLPLTGVLFLAGALGAAAIPPMNGFASEFLLLMSAYHGAAGIQPASAGAAVMFAAVIILAVAAGMAAAAYIKAFGFVFLGNAKGAGASSGGRESTAALVPHLLLAVTAAGIAAASPRVLSVIGPTAEVLVRLWRRSPNANIDLDLWLGTGALNPLASACAGGLLLAGCLAGMYLLRRLLVRNKTSTPGPTWDCGYAAPDSRMQYTASSFTRPLADDFRLLTGTMDEVIRPEGFFPAGGSFRWRLPGIEHAWGFRQMFLGVSWLAGKIRLMQAGQVQIYLLYMAAVLVLLLMWKL